MAFASSTSAFGMKPATTSIFGQNNPQQESAFGGAFGQQQNQQQQQPSTNIFGQPQQQQAAASTGLFGQTQPQQQQTTGTTGLFGQQQQQQQQNTGTTGLFGQPQQQQNTGTTGLFGQPQQNASTTNIFGQPQQQQNTGSTNIFGQPQQQQTTTTTNLFGQPQQQQNTTTTGLFGQQQQPQQQQPQTNLFGNSLFGSNANTNNNQQQQQQPAALSNPFGGLFGNNNNNTSNQQQQQPQSTNLFGGSTTTNPLQAQPTLGASAFGGGNTGGTGLFGGGGGLFGAKPQQPQQSNLGFSTQTPGAFGNSVAQPGINALQFPNGVPPFTKSTKFNDLPDEYKRLMENIDSFIQGRVQICKDLQQRKLGDEPVKGQDAIRQLNKELINTATTIRNDLHLTNDLKSKVDQAVEDTIVATRIIDGFRNPQSGNTYLKDHAAFPLEYFTRVTEQMKERLAWYQSTIEQIERKLASASSSTQTPQSISATLQAQHQIFLALANKTAAVDAELQKIKALYTQLWRSKTGSVRDPFNDIVKSSTAETAGDFGLGSLNFR